MWLATLLRVLTVHAAFYGQSTLPLTGLLAGSLLSGWADAMGHPWHWLRYWAVEGVFATAVYVLLERHSGLTCPAASEGLWCALVRAGAFYRCASAAYAATLLRTKLE